MKKIGIEEHFLTIAFMNYLHARTKEPRRESIDDPTSRRISDIGEGRLAEMDRAGIDMEVLSLGMPGVEDLEPDQGIIWAKQTNDELSKEVRKHPDRLAGVAALPCQQPIQAAKELERAVNHLGLKGAQVNSHVQGEYMDDKKFWPIFEMAEKLDVPIYIHPKPPSPQMLQPYLKYPRLDTAMWGYAAEVGLHAMRLICGGVFDEYPKLKIILGHMGEALPYWLWRIDNHFSRTNLVKELQRKPSEYFKDNFYLSTSGMFYQPALLCAYLGLGAEKILFAVDYPHESNDAGVKFIMEAAICDRDKEKICHLNAERLFKL